MAASEKTGVGKIILIVVGILLLITLICCAAGWFLVGAPAMEFGKAAQAFQQNLTAEFGPDVRMQMVPRGEQDVVLAFGFPESQELTPETVTDLQDRAWKIYAESFPEGGFPFVKAISVGLGGGSAQQGYVTGWEENVTTTEEMEARTGIAAPPPNQLTKWGEQDDYAPVPDEPTPVEPPDPDGE